MTLRGLFISFLVFTALSAQILIAASNGRTRFYDDLIASASKVQLEASKYSREEIREDASDTFSVPAGFPAISVLVRSTLSDAPLRIQYYKDGALVMVDRLGEGRKVVRRDIYHGRIVRVRQFFDQGHDLVQVVFLDAKGKIVYRQHGKDPLMIPPLPGWPYG